MKQNLVEVDSALILLAQHGDTRAFGQLVQHYQTPVYNLAYRMLGDPTEAEDAAQETFLRAYTQLKSYKPELKFASWLLSIAAHYCIDRTRRRKFVGFSLDDEAMYETLPAADADPAEVVTIREREAEAQHLLQSLSPDSRAIIILKYWHDSSVEEIATMTGNSVAAVKVKLFRARQTMAKASVERPHRSLRPVRSSPAEGVMSHAL
jgi:RNA polymerase sigma-70 factor (ECF subfamily)